VDIGLFFEWKYSCRYSCRLAVAAFWHGRLPCYAVCCNVLQYVVAVCCCNVLQYVVVWVSCCSSPAVICSVWQCVAVCCCNVLQYVVAMCCSMLLQYVAVWVSCCRSPAAICRRRCVYLFVRESVQVCVSLAHAFSFLLSLLLALF